MTGPTRWVVRHPHPCVCETVRSGVGINVYGTRPFTPTSEPRSLGILISVSPSVPRTTVIPGLRPNTSRSGRTTLLLRPPRRIIVTSRIGTVEAVESQVLCGCLVSCRHYHDCRKSQMAHDTRHVCPKPSFRGRQEERRTTTGPNSTLPFLPRTGHSSRV